MSSGEQRALSPASIQDLKDVEDRLTKRQDDAEARIKERQDIYEAKCDADRKELHSKVDSLEQIASRVEENVKVIKDVVSPLANLFKGILSNPKVQSAAILTVLAFLGFLTWKLNSMTGKTEHPVYIVPVATATAVIDGGVK